MSRSASEPLPLSPVISKNPCGQRVILREAEKKRRSRFAAQKAWRGIEGHNRRASGARDSSEPSRSESEAERVWKAASGTWETCGAKASAGVGRAHSSREMRRRAIARREGAAGTATPPARARAGQCPWMRRASACKRDDANQMARTIMSKDCNRGQSAMWRRVGNRSSIWRSIHRNQCETEPRGEGERN